MPRAGTRLSLLLAAVSSLTLAAAPGDILPGWPFQTGGIVFSSPAIGPHGEVVVGAEDNALYSLNPDGSLRWKFTGAGDWFDSSPTIAPDGTVYAGSWDNNLYALDGETGALKWKFATESIVIASPAIGKDGTIYVGSYDGLMYAIRPDGTLRWAYQPTYYNASIQQTDYDLSTINSSAVFNASGDTLYFGSGLGNFYAVNAATGTQRWVYSINSFAPEKGIVAAAAVGPDGSIYFGSENGNLYSLSPNGQFDWFFSATESILSSPVVDSRGLIRFAAQDGYLYTLDSAGSQLWETFVGDVFYCSPALDQQGNLIIGAYAGSATTGAASAFMAVNETGTILWTRKISGYNDSSPNIAPDGSIYIGAHNGLLYRLEGSSGPAQTGWPRFQANHRNTGWTGDLGEVGLIEVFPEIALGASGWVHVPWFGSGWLTEAGLPWVQHLDHGYIYVIGAYPFGVFFYDSLIGEWLYASSPAPDFYFRYNTGTWLYHFPGTNINTGRWFYDYSKDLWLPEAALY